MGGKRRVVWGFLSPSGGGPLFIRICDEHPEMFFSEAAGEKHRGRALSDPAFLIRNTDNLGNHHGSSCQFPPPAVLYTCKNVFPRIACTPVHSSLISQTT
jgi:hypothetical protein